MHCHKFGCYIFIRVEENNFCTRLTQNKKYRFANIAASLYFVYKNFFKFEVCNLKNKFITTNLIIALVCMIFNK